MTLVVVEGLAYSGVESTAQALAHEIGARHLALYEGHWENLSLEGHIIADEIAIQIALGLGVDVVLERGLPSTWVCCHASGTGFDQFKVAFLDHVISQNDHLGVFIRPKNFEEWRDLQQKSTTSFSAKSLDVYTKFDDLYMNYVRGSKMNWIICDPYPDIDRIIRVLNKERS